MPNPRKHFHINFNVLLSDELDDILIKLAKAHSLKKAQVVRRALLNWATMENFRTPLCADGQKCRCPHAHIYPPTPTTDHQGQS